MSTQHYKKGVYVAAIALSVTFLTTCKKSSTPVTPPKSKTYTITESSTFNGSITPAGVNTVAPGSNLTYIITPATNYGILSLAVDSVAVVPVTNVYFFSNVEANHTIKAVFAPVVKLNITVTNGTAVSSQAVVGGSAIVSITPSPTFHTDSLYINGTFVKLLAGATSYTVTNITAGETIKITCSDILKVSQLDSLKNLLIGQWTMTGLNSKLGNLQDTGLPWDIQPLYPCSATQYDQYYANGSYVANNNAASCNPLFQQQFTLKSPNHWTLKNNGKVIYMTDAPLDSLVNITVTKDSLIAFYFGGFTSVRGISYWYHYARK